MNRFSLERLFRQLLIWLGGTKGGEEKFFLFTLPVTLTPKQIWERMWPCGYADMQSGWGFNIMSHAYKKQICTMRKLDLPNHQYHLRFYSDGRVEGHYEVDFVNFPLEHHDSVDLRPLTEEEKLAIWNGLTSPRRR